jgi:hypothetical protein
MMEVWIGLVGVGPLPGSKTLGEAKGAYVNALAVALNSQQYEETVKAALDELALFAFEFEDVEQFSERASRMELDEKLHDLAEGALRSGRVCFDDFHTYANTDS